ncbi:hypothetical protein D9M68_654050 [compost metagenome]
MQAPQHTTGRPGVVVLDERQIDTGIAVAFDVEALEEEAARVAKYLGLDDQHARQRSFDHIHG